jgi:hypothetical protein
VVSHAMHTLMGSSGSYMIGASMPASIASLSSNIYSSVSSGLSVLRGTLASGEERDSASVVHVGLMDEVGRVRGVLGVSGRRMVLMTEKAGVVVARMEEGGGKLVVEDVAGVVWEEGGSGDGNTKMAAAACLQPDKMLLAISGGFEGDGDGTEHCDAIVLLRNVVEDTQVSIVCPGAVQDVVFLHQGKFLGVLHYDDASGKTLLTLVPVSSCEMAPTSVGSTLAVTSGELTVAYARTDLYDIYVRGSAVGGDEAMDVMLLTSSGVRCVQLMSWKQKLSAMVASKRFEEALLHAVTLYLDTGNEGKHMWPANQARDATAVSKQVLSLLLMYVEQIMDREDFADDGSARNLVRMTLDVCSLVNEISSAFYADLPQLFQRSEVTWTAYLDIVLEYCRERSTSSNDTSVPPQIIQSLVERVFSSPSLPCLSSLEDVLLSFEVSSLDLNQVLPMCMKHGLYSVLIYVFTRGMVDFKGPAALLFAKAVAEEDSKRRQALVSKLLVYVHACFEGLVYPLGDINAQREQTEETKTTMRLAMMEFLLFTTVSQVRQAVDLWGALGGEHGEGEDGLACFEEVTSPVLAFLCETDAQTILGLLQKLLSAWDGLVSDLGPEHRGHDGTLSQVAVDRVVDFLGDGQSVDDGSNAKLDFIAGLVSSNRASLPPGATLSLLKFLSRNFSQSERNDVELRENILEIVKHAPAEALDDEVLDVARQAGFAVAEAEILLKRGAYRDAIRSLLASEADSHLVFSWYRDIVARGNHSSVSFQKAILPDFPRLVEIDARATAEIAVDFAGHQRKEIIDSFEKDSNAQFRFLGAVVDVLRERDHDHEGAERVYEASPWIVLLKGKTISNVFIRLMCRFDPDSVLGYLKSAEYDIDECLDCCQTNRLRAAQAFLLERKGDLDGALRVQLEEIEAINEELVNLDTSEPRDALAKKSSVACDTAASLCARLQAQRGTRPSQAGASEHEEPIESKHHELVEVYVRAYAKNGDRLSPWAKGVLTRHIKRVAQQASHPEAMVEHVTDTFQEEPVRVMKDVLAVLLGVCDLKARKAALAADIATKEVGEALWLTYRRLSTGRSF